MASDGARLQPPFASIGPAPLYRQVYDRVGIAIAAEALHRAIGPGLSASRAAARSANIAAGVDAR